MGTVKIRITVWARVVHISIRVVRIRVKYRSRIMVRF